MRKDLASVFQEYGVQLERFVVATVVRPDGNREYEDLKKVHNSRFVDVEKAKINQTVSIIDAKTAAEVTGISTHAESMKIMDLSQASALAREIDPTFRSGQPEPAVAPAAWYAGIGGQRAGPFTVAELSKAVQEGRVSNETQVWRKGMAGWSKIDDQPDLAALFSDLPPPLPPE
jgi:hypothetical protein